MILFFEKLPKNEKKNPHDLAKLAYQWSPPPWPHHKSFFKKNNASSKALEYQRNWNFITSNNIFFSLSLYFFFSPLIYLFIYLFWGGAYYIGVKCIQQYSFIKQQALRDSIANLAKNHNTKPLSSK